MNFQHKYIVRESVPCWYELIWRETKGMILRIHTEFVNGVALIPNNAPIVEHIMNDKGFGFRESSFVFGQDMGFNKALPFVGEQNGFLEYTIPTPLVRKPTGKACRSCKGTGDGGAYTDRSCFYCNGEREEVIYDYSDAYAVSASLGLLFAFMRFPEVETTCSLPQLMLIETVTIRENHGGSLYGEFSKDLVRFLRSLAQPCEIKSMVSVMQAVWEKMDGRMQGFYEHSFRSHLRDSGRLIVDCPGDACGLHPDMHYSGGNDGYKFNCHNTDTMMQQLVLLSALAELQSFARSTVV